MKRTPVVLCVLLILMAIILCGCAGSPAGSPGKESTTRLVSSFEGGYLYMLSHTPVAQLNGSYMEMGRQYGGLLRNRIKKFLAEFEKTIIKHTGLSELSIEEKANKVFSAYPKRIKAIFEGMEETSGVPLKKLKQLDIALLLGCMSEQDSTSCTAVAAWGYNTLGWYLNFGRNLDLPGCFAKCNDALALIVYNPDDGSHSIATIVYAGQVSSMQVFNDAGIVVEANSTVIPNDNIELNGGTFLENDMLMWLLECGDLDVLTSLVCKARLFGPVILTIADKTGAISIERTAGDSRKVPPTRECYVVAVDNFVDPTWGSSAPLGPHMTSPDTGEQASLVQDSEQRYRNMFALSEKYKHKWDLSTMARALDTPVKRGGAFKPTTTIQFVYVPISHTFILKAPGCQNIWIDIYLTRLLKGINKRK